MSRRSPLVLALLLLVVATTAGQLRPSLWQPPVFLPRLSDPLAPPVSVFSLTRASGALGVHAMTTDAQGNVYVAGIGNATDVPGLERGFKPIPTGLDAFVAKVDRAGQVVWANYLGGTDRDGGDIAIAIAVDNAGAVYVGGRTPSPDFPTVNAFQTARLGPNDGFIAKISADGRRLLYSSYVGGRDGSASVQGVAVGPTGEVWLKAGIVGQPVLSHDLSRGIRGAVVVKLNPSGNPIWSTRLPLPTSFVVPAPSFAVDGAGRVHMAGSICPTFWTADCRFSVLRLSASGSSLEWETTWGNSDAGGSIGWLALLPDGRAVLTGSTATAQLPVRNNRLTPGRVGSWLAVFDSSGAIETLMDNDIGGVIATIDSFGRLIAFANTRFVHLPVVKALVDRHVDGPMYVSHDRGTTWSTVGRESIPEPGFYDLDFDPHRNSLYVVVPDGRGIYESDDSGQSWHLDRSLTTPRLQSAETLAVDPFVASVRYASIGNEVYRDDNGSGWRRVLLRVPNWNGVEVNPLDGSVWAASSEGTAVSHDRGETWTQKRANGFPMDSRGVHVFQLAFNPLQPGLAYVATDRGLFVTRNAGDSWENLTAGTPAFGEMYSIAFDPVRPAVMYVTAGSSTRGLLRTADGGRTWTHKLASRAVRAVATDHMKRHIVYAAGVDADGRPAFYRSIDWGETWHRASDGLDTRGVPTHLLVDPRDSSTIYLGMTFPKLAPYIWRGGIDSRGPRADFASYLGHGTVTAVTTTQDGDLILAVTPDKLDRSAPDPQLFIRIAAR